MDTSKINKDAKTIANVLIKSEDVQALSQELNKVLVKRKKPRLVLTLTGQNLSSEEYD